MGSDTTKTHTEPVISTIEVQDDTRLESLGYEQELKRDISMFETFGFAFSIMGVLPSIASTIFYNMPYGGPVSMTWGWLLASILILFVGCAMADLASSMPTSGGLYYWTHKMAPAPYRNFLAWFVGYNSFLGNIAATSSLAWALSGIIFTAVSLSNPDFSATTGQTFGLYVGLLAFIGAVCAYGTKVVARMQNGSVALNAVLVLVTVIGLPIARRNDLNTAAFTFTDFSYQATSWQPGFAFILSMLAPVWTICSFDSAVSISEEATNAAIAVPWAITGAIAIAGLSGFLILVILALTMGTDIAAVYEADVGQPLAVIYQMAFGSNGTLAIWSLVCVAQLFMTLSLALPASRQAFAFARDGALPFSKYWYHVDKYSGTPVRTVWLVVGLCVPLGALGFASDAAINAIFTLAIIGPYVAYMIPIGCRVLWGDKTFIPGPWYLGRASKPVAAIAVIWMLFACVIFCFPADVDPEADTMNYAIAVAAAVWLFSIAYWFMPKIGGKTFFTGPCTHAVDYTAPRDEGLQRSSSDVVEGGKM